MRFGICCHPDQISLVKAAGFDYVELSLSGLAAMTVAERNALRDLLNEQNIKAEAFNCFFPSDIPLVGPSVNLDRVRAYVDRALSYARALGGEIIVLGSGACRKTPMGFPADEARKQLKQMMAVCGDIAARHDMKIALEPLNTRETDQINTVAEGLAICREIGHPQVGCLVDFFHVFMSGETMDAVASAGGMLVHAHLARPNTDRGIPRQEDMPTLEAWADALKTCGYDTRISFEGAYGENFPADMADIMQAMTHFLSGGI